MLGRLACSVFHYGRQAALVLSFVLCPMALYGAAEPLSPVDRDTIQQQQRELLQQNQLERQQLKRSLTPSLPAPAVPAQTPGPCFVLDTIRLEGADHLPEKDQKQLIESRLHRCHSLARIQELVKEISDWYISRGYITSRAFLTPQDLSKGELKVLVMEGRLETVLLDGQDSRQLKMAFPGMTGRILNLRDIEQGMEQINRLRRDPVQIEILPGSKPGYSTVNLTASPEFPLHVGLGFDNSGQKSTGVGQLNASLTGNNLLGLADQWFVSGSHSSDFASDHDSRSVQAGFSLPWGYWTLDYSYAWSDYLSTVENNGFDWQSSGDQQTHRLGLNRVIYRDGQRKTALSLGMTHRINHNYLNDVLLGSSSRKLSSVTAGVNHSQKLWRGFATFSPVYSRGVSWLGAEGGNSQPDAPKADFNKFSLSGSYYLPLTREWTWLTSFYGQWSADRLYGSERLTIGGDASVRGFKEQYLSGDKGGYWRNEVNRSLITLPVIGSVSALAVIDGGWLHHDKLNKWGTGTLWGGALGLSSSNRYYSSQVTVGWPISSPDWLDPDRVSVWYRINFVL